MIITIDGPVGSGKSSVAQALAKRLKIHYLNTGLLYRAAAYILINKLKKAPENIGPLNENELSLLDKITYEFVENDPTVYFENEALTDDLYNLSLDRPASLVSQDKQVRERLSHIQKNIAEKYDIVAEGRDLGSVVFPNADYKFFLTASVDIRAQRVAFDEKRNIKDNNLEKVKKEIELRDERDETREVSPLIVPNNAFIVDNSNLTFEETVQEFLRQIQK
ncbi:MAG: (d)CMP kinase [bacterium]